MFGIRFGVREGRLVLPSRRQFRGATLVLTADAAVLEAPRAGVSLAWPSFGASNGWNLHWIEVPPSILGAWSSRAEVTFQAPSDGAAGPVRAASGLQRAEKEVAVLHREYEQLPGSKARRDMAVALLTALAKRPELRPGLDRPVAVRQLVADMRTTPMKAVEPPLGWRRRSVEVVTALYHPGGPLTDAGSRAIVGRPRILGRPLPGDPPIDPQALTDAVLRFLDNPWARARGALTADDIAPALRRLVVDVKPWPFQALVARPDV